jgi:hypothetical protein
LVQEFLGFDPVRCVWIIAYQTTNAARIHSEPTQYNTDLTTKTVNGSTDTQKSFTNVSAQHNASDVSNWLMQIISAPSSKKTAKLMEIRY